MSDDAENAADPATEQPEPAAEHAVAESGRNRRIILIATAVIAVLVLAGGAGLYLLWDRYWREGPGVVTVDLGGPSAYYELAEIVSDLKPAGGGSHHIKLVAVVELPKKQHSVLASKETAIVDLLQTYLRQQDYQTLAGEAGAERLRSELLVIINRRIAPAQASNVLFKTLLLD